MATPGLPKVNTKTVEHLFTFSTMHLQLTQLHILLKINRCIPLQVNINSTQLNPLKYFLYLHHS